MSTKRRLSIILLTVVLIAAIGIALVLNRQSSPATGTRNSGAAPTQQQRSDESIARSLTPCELLTDNERAQFNLGTGEADNKNIRGCDWDLDDNLYVNLKIYPLYGLDKVPIWENPDYEPLTIGSHQAQLSKAPQSSIAYGACQVNIALGATKSASLTLSANGKSGEAPDKYCDIVRQLAAFVEPKLPKN